MLPKALTSDLATTAPRIANEELAANVSRFEQLVAEHSDYLRRIELLLDEIEVSCDQEQ
jgi:hypothetical protein